MSEFGDDHPIVPGAVRKYEIQQPTFFTSRLAFEKRLCVLGEFENPNALLHVGLLRFLMAFDIAKAATLLLAPFPRHPVEKLSADLSIELVDVHSVDARLKPLVLRAKPSYSLTALVTFVRMAGVQRLPHPLQHLVVEAYLAEERNKLLFEDLLAHILPPTASGLAPAFVGVSSAVVVDVLLLLDLSDHRAAALPTRDQPGKRKIVL